MTEQNEMNDENSGETSQEQGTDELMKSWLDENGWFREDAVARALACEVDQKLQTDGVPLNRQRLDHVASRVREALPERFYDSPARAPKWGDIADPTERKQAREAFLKANWDLQYSGKKISEEEYLKNYLNG